MSHETISKITDRVLDEFASWQNRPLGQVYPVLFIDALAEVIRLLSRATVIDMSSGDRTKLTEHQWRLLWEERLGPDARHRIRRVALMGAPLTDLGEAAVAIEFARRRRRIARVAAVVNTSVTAGRRSNADSCLSLRFVDRVRRGLNSAR